MFKKVDAKVAAHHTHKQAEEALKQHEVEQQQAQEAITETYFMQNTMTLMKKLIHLDELTDEGNIATEAQGISIMPGGQTVDIATENLTINNITNFSIQSNKGLPNQATAPCHQNTHVRQPTRYAVKAAAPRQQKQVRMT